MLLSISASSYTANGGVLLPVLVVVLAAAVAVAADWSFRFAMTTGLCWLREEELLFFDEAEAVLVLFLA
jgi:hypothetical protein